MTLKEWSQKTGIKPTHPTSETGTVSLISEPKNELHKELWKLEDYKVTSVHGVVIWLTPKTPRLWGQEVRTIPTIDEMARGMSFRKE